MRNLLIKAYFLLATMICLVWVKLRLLTHTSKAKARELKGQKSLTKQIYVIKSHKKIIKNLEQLHYILHI